VIIGKVKDAIKNEELRAYLLIVFISIFAIVLNILTTNYNSFKEITGATFEETFRNAYFQVASIITTTGYSTTNYEFWPELSKTIIIILMLFGAMAGSTGGGIKISRIVIAIKGTIRNLRKLINPRYVPKTKFEDKPLEESVINDVFAYLTLYFFLLIIVVLVLSFDPLNGQIVEIASENGVGTYAVEHGFTSNFTAALSCLSNIGP
jgi:trk system potassium uptake protein TrkH